VMCRAIFEAGRQGGTLVRKTLVGVVLAVQEVGRIPSEAEKDVADKRSAARRASKIGGRPNNARVLSPPDCADSHGIVGQTYAPGFGSAHGPLPPIYFPDAVTLDRRGRPRFKWFVRRHGNQGRLFDSKTAFPGRDRLGRSGLRRLLDSLVGCLAAGRRSPPEATADAAGRRGGKEVSGMGRRVGGGSDGPRELVRPSLVGPTPPTSSCSAGVRAKGLIAGAP